MSCPKNCDCKQIFRFMCRDVYDVHKFAFVVAGNCPNEAAKLLEFPPGLKARFMHACGYGPRDSGSPDAWRLRVCRPRRRSAYYRWRWSGVPRRRASERTWDAVVEHRIPRGCRAMSRRLAKLVIANARRCGFPIPRAESARKGNARRAIRRINAARYRYFLRRAHFDEGGTRATWKRELWAAKAGASEHCRVMRGVFGTSKLRKLGAVNMFLSAGAEARRRGRRARLVGAAKTDALRAELVRLRAEAGALGGERT